MNSKGKLVGLAPLALVAGCSSLDQVPMVYVSTVKVGVDVASGSSTTPGAKLMVGVDATDAALVPVRVSRHCKVSALVDCSDDKYPIFTIYGDNNVSVSELLRRATAIASSVNGESRVLREKSQEFVNATDALKNAKLALEKATSAERLAEVYDRKNSLSNSGNAPEDPTEPVEVTRARATAKGQIQAAADLQEAEASERSARLAFVQALEVTASKATEMHDVANGDPEAPVGTRHDALSVYGTFNGSANGAADQAKGNVNGGLNLGKSFSTGIAAQLLAEAAKRNTTTNCLAQAHQLATFADAPAPGEAAKPAVVHKDILETAVAACKSGASSEFKGS